MTDTEKDRYDDITEHHSEANALDRELDANLAELAAVEPRAGLEERILANLWLEQARATQPSWWRWPAAATLAALIVVTMSVALRSSKPAQNIAEQRPPATKKIDKHPGTQLADDSGNRLTRPHEAAVRRVKPHQSNRQATVLSAPKLDQFPSPQPLSEQEEILARYVTNYPAHAALIAQARTEELRRDRAEQMSETGPGIENSQP